MKLPLDHVAIAVPSIADALPIFERLTGATGSPTERLEAQDVVVAFLGDRDVCIELIEPIAPDSAVARFLERYGPGLHHVAFHVPDVAAALERLARAGFTPLDPEPRPGARGHIVAFLHPRDTSGVLIELVQH